LSVPLFKGAEAAGTDFFYSRTGCFHPVPLAVDYTIRRKCGAIRERPAAHAIRR